MEEKDSISSHKLRGIIRKTSSLSKVGLIDSLQSLPAELLRGLSSDEETIIKGEPELSFVLQKLVRFTDERKATHNASRSYFDKLNTYFFWPGIACTTMTSALAFMATQYPSKSQEFNVSIGLLGCFSTLIVALSETYRYGARAEQHASAAESYDKLRTKLFFKALEIKSTHTKSDMDNNLKQEILQFISTVETQISDINNNCKDLIPSKIVTEYKYTRYKSLKSTLKRNLQTLQAKVDFNKAVNTMKTDIPPSTKDSIGVIV